MDSALKNSTFGYQLLAAQCSLKNDSVASSQWLLAANPYHLAWWWNEYVHADSILQHYKITERARLTFRELFSNAMASQSQNFKQFKVIRDEDQAIRSLYDKCGDSIACAKAQRLMEYTDSVHFWYLHDYVQKNGWPSIDDGSLYASLIAVHDHLQYDRYIPLMKQAILRGQLPYDPLKFILYWKSQKGPDNLQAYLDTVRHMQFDVSSIFNHQLPLSLPRIKDFMRTHCKGKKYLVIEARSKNVYDTWIATFYRWSNKENDNSISDLLDELRVSCNDPGRKWLKGTWEVSYIPSDRQKEKLLLYIVY